jgi:endoglucanase
MTRFNLLLILLPALFLAACSHNSGKTEWTINDQEYLETPGFNVLVFNDYYPEGKQGGIEFIHHDNRTATNGFINVKLEGGKRFPMPEKAVRTIDRKQKEITARVSVPEYNFNYAIRIWPENGSVHLAVDLDKPVPAEWKGRMAFELQLFPVTYGGRSYHLGDKFGVFPVEGLDPMITTADGKTEPVPMAIGNKLMIAPEDPLYKLEIEQLRGNMSLIDDRNSSLGGWIMVRSEIPDGVQKGALEWVITPNLIAGWLRTPVVSMSQVGYHPDQLKQAIIELDQRATKIDRAVLRRIGNDGTLSEVKSILPRDWGKFLRYRYEIFDFSEVKDPGIYTVSYGNVTGEPFSIGRDVYRQHVWQPTLEIFFPVQMCHMRIRDRGRVWHGACHLDDALQAPLSTVLPDGYRTYATTETNYKPVTTIPGLNRGGWHDAGDNDLAAGSQAQTTLLLALAGEEFGINVDQTSINQNTLSVILRRPDGVPDLQQQIEHGVINLLSGYRASGHSFVGIIESKEGRGFLGDVASESDQLFYDPSLKPGEVRGNRSGNPDDRWVVTNRDASLEYEVITALAASSRLLRGYNDKLAQECLSTSEKAWGYEQSHVPVIQPNAYVPGHYEQQEVKATCELLATTGESRYRDRLIALLPVIKANPRQIGWAAARVVKMVNDEAFTSGVKEALQSYRSELDTTLSKSPFGVPWNPAIWGIGWNIQDYAVAQYYLHRAFPDLFGSENLYRVVNYVLGCHPGSSTSLVSGVGAHSIIPAYGFNMHWWSYIPGGMVSGTALIRPDFPEMKEPYPYLWQQTEYVMPGAASYIFCILAADKLLNE